MGRKKYWHEQCQARFAAGTLAQIDSVLWEKEPRTEFIRRAVEYEVIRRRMRQEAIARQGKPARISTTWWR